MVIKCTVVYWHDMYLVTDTGTITKNKIINEAWKHTNYTLLHILNGLRKNTLFPKGNLGICECSECL